MTPRSRKGLRVFGDYAGGLLLSDAEIDRERAIILSEKRARDSVGYRTFVAQFEAMLGTTRFPRRLPIGTPEVISTAPRERFLDFWNTWYRPERMLVTVVGDFTDVDAIEKMVRTSFEKLTARAPAAPGAFVRRAPEFEGVRAIFHAEPEAPATSVEIAVFKPYTRERDTKERQIKRLPRSLALSMLNRRFSVLAKKEGAPFVTAGASVNEQFDFLRAASVDLSCKPEQWSAALAAGEQELRRALEHGFTAGELTEAAANIANQLEQAAKTASTRHSNRLADELVQTILEGQVFTTPADDLALLKPALEKITPADCVAALRQDFEAPGRYVMVTGNAAIPGDATAAIQRAYDEAHAVAVTAPEANQQGAWAYTDFGPPGEIEKREHVADLDITQVTFKNGVRLNLKRTDFEAGRIQSSVRIGNGSITEPPGKRGLAGLAGGTFTAGGLGKHSVDELRNLLAGRNVGWGFGPGAETLRFSATTTPDDLGLNLELLAAHLTDPGYRPEALRVAQKGLEQLYLSFKHTANGPLSTEVANLLASGDPRFGMPPQEEMMTRNLEEVKAWLSPQFATARSR
jgi:zinc protease